MEDYKLSDDLELVQDHMSKNGFDPTCPIILGEGDWTNVPVVIDGHTRLEAANNLGIEPVFTTKWFESGLAALEECIRLQSIRVFNQNGNGSGN